MLLKWLIGVAVALALSTTASAQGKARAVTLSSRDRVSISALAWEAAQAKAVILLFHQAGSSKAEYATIAPPWRLPATRRLPSINDPAAPSMARTRPFLALAGLPRPTRKPSPILWPP